LRRQAMSDLSHAFPPVAGHACLVPSLYQTAWVQNRMAHMSSRE